MLRKICFLLLIVLSILALASCGNGKDDNSNTDTGSEDTSSVCLHTWERTQKDDLIFEEATCQSARQYFAVCSKCGIKGSPYSYGDIGAHIFGNYPSDAYLITPATCTQGAEYYKSCAFCMKTSEETFVDPILALHSYKDIMNKETFYEYATCTTPSKYRQSCSECGKLGEVIFSIGPKLPHTDTEGDYMCDFCLQPMKVFYDVPSDKLADVDELENPYGG
jgi:hypothetical protein